jgi:hypothetical protein
MDSFSGGLAAHTLAMPGEQADAHATARRKARLIASIGALKKNPAEQPRVDSPAARSGISGDPYDTFPASPRSTQPAAASGSAGRRLNETADWIVWIAPILALAITAVLFWFANLAQPVQIADVTLQPNSSIYLGPLVVTATGRVDHGGVPLQVTGMLTGAASSVAAIELDTRPSGESLWQKQPACCQITGNLLSGSADLPAASAPDFDFQLVSTGDNPVLATGILTVRTQSFPGGSQLAINFTGTLGAIAAFLEFARLASRWHTTPEPVLSPIQGESNAKKR